MLTLNFYILKAYFADLDDHTQYYWNARIIKILFRSRSPTIGTNSREGSPSVTIIYKWHAELVIK